MDYKTIVVHMDGSAHCAARVQLACRLARDFDAHLVGVYAVEAPEPVAFADSSYSQFRIAQQEQAAERAQSAAASFTALTRAAGAAKSEFRRGEGGAVEALALHARYADLVVIGQVDPDEGMVGVRPSFPEFVVLSIGRPVLIVPYYAAEFPQFGRHILVAWNASREASRAVSDSLPLLGRALRVSVMAVNPDSAGKAHGELPSADIALYLARHNVRAEATQSYSDEIGVGEELLARASDMDVDLLVMGAYGHSRIREVILGGVTQTMLKHMTVPVLMSH